MKRIYYGALTLDVSNEVAEHLKAVVAALATRQHYRNVPAGGGMISMQPYAYGQPAFETVSGYLNGSENEESVELFLNGSTPVAIGGYFGRLNDPAGSSETLARLKEWLPTAD